MTTTINVPSRVVRRYAEDHGLQEAEAVRDFDELVRFLTICSSTPERCAPSEALDEVWHTFIQFTREYREFCLSNFGRMIDHDPSPREENIQPHLLTCKIAEERYGVLDPVFWPGGAAGATMCGAPGAPVGGATVCDAPAN
ncbi:MAG: hypothetical protein Q7R80_03455 [bacterium]|nr:hypothetical protein [bacterium]